ncbi:transmembrane protein, putative [Bodo saltans]|uniref:Transmembrane protein, putative n=1 Tax=Bodo saltans TaxID=75058 RepID=A0A0S4JNZ8_BODSA|nr:transmembrane protein, putative [Bodo saltans]|eukprot:CUG93271.1 transmembrane protein, putative [Bodo saltans]
MAEKTAQASFTATFVDLERKHTKTTKKPRTRCGVIARVEKRVKCFGEGGNFSRPSIPSNLVSRYCCARVIHNKTYFFLSLFVCLALFIHRPNNNNLSSHHRK